MTGLFVTGTGTNVGKTVASAALLHRYRQVAPWRYWKPVQTGAPPDDDTGAVRTLGLCADDEICALGVRLRPPLSPHLAAQICGVEFDVSSLLGIIRGINASRRWLIEGAGGVLVPLNRTELMTDLMAALALPAVIVASSELGTINHTLLTIEALRGRSIGIAGVIMNGNPNPENRAAIETYGNVAVIGEMPPFASLDPQILADWAVNRLDPEGRLEPLFAGNAPC